MALSLLAAKESHADRIATIHMAAFGANVLLQAQFPTPTIRDKLKKCIAEKAIEDIRDPKTAVLLVQRQNNIISFAKWHLPVSDSEAYVEPPWRWPEGTNLAIIEEWGEKVEAAKQKIIGNTPCYRLSFIGTDPHHERRGAASLLVQWGLEHCKKDEIPAYLESTVDAGSLYEKNGFEASEMLSIVLNGVMKDAAAPVIYKEICFVYRTSVASCISEQSIRPPS